MKLARRICLSLAALVVLCAAFVGPAAQIVQASGEVSKISPFSFTPSRQQVVDTVSQDQQNGDYTQASYQLSSFTTFMGGAGIALMGGTDSSGNQVAQGVVPQLGKAMAFMIEQPPASTQVWIADLIDNSPLLGEKAYAQGVGFKSLTPILPIWKTFRDISYIAFIFAFVAVGFMIMFRHKLNGQTVATISNALPRMVVTLLLITFSYAIAGFLIDLMYVLIYFICSVFASLLGKSTGELANIALSKNIIVNGLGFIWPLNGVAGSAASQLGAIVQGFFNTTDALGNAIITLLGAGATVIGFLIFAIAIFFAVVKTFFELLKSYVTFIIMVIFSPFQLLIGMFKEGGDFAQWLRNMIATLAPFPVVIVMLFLAMALGGQGAGDVGFKTAVGQNALGFYPPQLNIGSQTGAVGAIQGLIVIGVVMLIPEAVKISKDALKATSPFDKYLPDITKNLERGWKGGQLVDGIGPNLPAANKILPFAAGVAGTAGTSVLTGAAGAGIGAYSQRDSGIGRQIGGFVVGGATGAAAPVALKYGQPIVQKVTKFGQKQITNARVAEEVINSFTPNQAPQTPESRQRTQAVRTALPTTPQGPQGTPPPTPPTPPTNLTNI